jgi:hypothetical protein
MKSLKEMMRRVGSGSKIVSLLEASITDNDAEIALALPAFFMEVSHRCDCLERRRI